MITITEHTRNEWSRMAKAAYASGHNDIGHRFSVAATQTTMNVYKYDWLMIEYREWLCWNKWAA